MGEEKITKTAVKAEAVPPKTVDKVVIEKKTAKKSAKDAPKVTYDENSILHLEGLESHRYQLDTARRGVMDLLGLQPRL